MFCTFFQTVGINANFLIFQIEDELSHFHTRARLRLKELCLHKLLCEIFSQFRNEKNNRAKIQKQYLLLIPPPCSWQVVEKD